MRFSGLKLLNHLRQDVGRSFDGDVGVDPFGSDFSLQAFAEDRRYANLEIADGEDFEGPGSSQVREIKQDDVCGEERQRILRLRCEEIRPEAELFDADAPDPDSSGRSMRRESCRT